MTTAHTARNLLPPGMTYVRLVAINATVRAYKAARGERQCARCGAAIPAGRWYTLRAVPGNRYAKRPNCQRCAPFDALRSTLGA